MDIWSKSPYPANVLSNLYDNAFRFDEVACGSMEGFLQSLKYKDVARQQEICRMSGKEAKRMSLSDWQIDQIVWWRSKAVDRQSAEFQNLVQNAYQAMYEQNETFRNALAQTTGQKLYHSRGEQDPRKTILTEKEFCDTLTILRNK